MDAIPQRFEALTRADPEQPVADGPGGVWTRAALLERARELAAGLVGLPAGAVVGLACPRGPAFLAGFLAGRIAGVCVLLLDGATPADEQRRHARGLGAHAIWRPALAGADGDALERLDGTAAFPTAACLKLSSGSTAAPKAIVVPTRSLVADVEALSTSMGFGADDRFLAAIPLSHAYGLSVLASPALWFGATLVFPEVGAEFEAAERYGATVLPSVPSWFEAQLARGLALPAGVRLVMTAGAPLSPRTASAWRAAHGRGIHVLYGSSECGGIAYDRTGSAAERGAVGTAVDGVRIELDADGCVVVHSDVVGAGYHPPDAAGDARFAERCFRTEDLAEFRDGELVLRGRRSDWINVKGHKVDPLEIARVLQGLAGVRDVAVLPKVLPDGRGEGIRAVIACPPGALGVREVLAWCSARLAPHKRPRSVVFVERLPRTARGKLDRAALEVL